MIQYDLKKAFTFIEPGPVTLITTFDGKVNNVCAISWTIVTDFGPECHIGIVTGSWNLTFDTLMATKECVVCIPPASMLKTTIDVGTVSGRTVDKFKAFNLTPAKGIVVSAPLIEECVACLECKQVDYIPTYNLIMLECKALWVDPDKEFQPLFHANGDGTFRIDGEEVFNYRVEMSDKVPEGCARF